MSNPALIVFAKSPIPGAVKTRLAAAIGDENAALLYRAFLTDALAAYRQLGITLRLYVSPPLKAFPVDLVSEFVTLHAQQGAGLGERMLHSLLESFAAGHDRAVIIGTDHPTLPLDFVHLAFDALEERGSVCIGPSDDGGYYLIGMNELYPAAFTGMAYSHPDVFSDTLDRLESTTAAVTVLPAWYDVDDADSLQRLRRDLRDHPASAPETYRLLSTRIL